MPGDQIGMKQVRSWLSEPHWVERVLEAEEIGITAANAGLTWKDAINKATLAAHDSGMNVMESRRHAAIAAGACLIASKKTLKEAANGAATLAREQGASIEEAAVLAGEVAGAGSLVKGGDHSAVVAAAAAACRREGSCAMAHKASAPHNSKHMHDHKPDSNPGSNSLGLCISECLYGQEAWWCGIRFRGDGDGGCEGS